MAEKSPRRPRRQRVARRPSAASREKKPAAAGISIRRFFSLEQRVEKKEIGPRRFFFFYLSCHTPTHKRAERRARNIADCRRRGASSGQKTEDQRLHIEGEEPGHFFIVTLCICMLVFVLFSIRPQGSTKSRSLHHKPSSPAPLHLPKWGRHKTL